MNDAQIAHTHPFKQVSNLCSQTIFFPVNKQIH